MLSRPYAFNCIMRLRTSSEFKPGHSVSKTISVSMDHIFQGLVLVYAYDICVLQYGHFFPDPQYENVQHIICCDSYATYAYDFDFANASGFARYNYVMMYLIHIRTIYYFL